MSLLLIEIEARTWEMASFVKVRSEKSLKTGVIMGTLGEFSEVERLLVFEFIRQTHICATALLLCIMLNNMRVQRPHDETYVRSANSKVANG